MLLKKITLKKPGITKIILFSQGRYMNNANYLYLLKTENHHFVNSVETLFKRFSNIYI